MTSKQAIALVLETNMELAKEYRCAIEREIWHVKRIYGMKLNDDVKKLLKQSIKEIATPAYPTPPCRESVAAVWNRLPKINFLKIRAEYLDAINEI